MSETTDVELPSSWSRARLETVADIHDELRRPVNASERELRPGTIPYYGATGQVGWIDDYLLDGEYVLLGEDGAPFLDASKPKAYIISGKSWVNNHAHVLRAKDGVANNHYLLYALNATNYHDAVNGTTRLKLTQSAMKDLTLPLPPLAEQRRIVAAIEEQFTRLDAGVAALKRAQAALKRYRAAVLKAAVEGRLTAAWRAQHADVRPASELLADILAERRAKWEADLRAKGKDPAKARYEEPKSPQTEGLPELPPGWVWATVSSISTKVVDGVHKKPNYVEHGIPFVTVRNLTAGLGISFERLNYITPEDHAEFRQRADPEREDLLISKDGTLGVVRVVDTDQPFSIFVSVALIKPVNKAMTRYLAMALSSPQVQSLMVSKGSGLQHIHLEDLRAVAVPIPPASEQGEIVAVAEQKLSYTGVLESTIAVNLKRAERLRQAILERAFTGRLVPQDPADEPASALLEQIRRERAGDGGKQGVKVMMRAMPLWGGE